MNIQEIIKDLDEVINALTNHDYDTIKDLQTDLIAVSTNLKNVSQHNVMESSNYKKDQRFDGISKVRKVVQLIEIIESLKDEVRVLDEDALLRYECNLLGL